MKQYLLSILPARRPATTAEVLQKVMRDVGALIDETKSAGAWVFNAGLCPPSTATVLRLKDGDLLTTDGPYAEGKGTHRRFCDRQGGGSRRRAGMGPQLARSSRFRLRSGRFSTESAGHRAGIPRGIRACGGRSGPPIWRHRRRRRGGPGAFTVAVERWPATGLPPSPAGWIITTARNRAIDRLRREASREDRHAQAVLLHLTTNRTRRVPCPTIDYA
jgi:hypothetical protein